ncbi:coiled-coil domain-containing protein [Herbaspirillum sp. alder98]|uniref:coiled-coil domain-containing protein n=1 Tax=Herbaspirillum sp. alder98 TaxID=2913096 RepID=UPI001CD880B1|nr:coiled-coil domain-containing protein [Herbaspirillum sp. alder98]MCA1323751.1 CCDC90 family protein [Herbaspirillum sp. alder98]
MATTFFDTHAYVKQLEASGVSTEQAEAHASALAQAMNTELSELRAEMNTRFAEARGQFELLKWMMGFTLAGVVGILFKLFH